VQNQVCLTSASADTNTPNPETQGGTAEGKRTCVGDTTTINDDSYREQQTYDRNEATTIYLPKSGWLTMVFNDIDANDSLTWTRPTTAPVASADANLRTAALGAYVDVPDELSTIEWVSAATDSDGLPNTGWTVVFQPNYPEVSLNFGTKMYNAGSGYSVVGVYGSADVTATSAGDEDGLNARYVETSDWTVPNVTCTPTTMHCPVPGVWAHINYTTPSLYPEPAEGSCQQQKAGVSSLVGCGDKTGLDTRWYGDFPGDYTSAPGVSAQNTNEEDNGQTVADDVAQAKHANWAGNCGNAESYFWLEKIACGSTRAFDTARSLIIDNIVLTPTPEDIRTILDLYYTTKAPLGTVTGGDYNNPGITFIDADYHVPPVLPPKLDCTCHAGMDAYASLLSVVSLTPTPGAPVTLDPEVLNTGTSKIVATLRLYQDPTYSIPSSNTQHIPMVVSRFYLEMSTKFTRNRITVSDCQAAHVENKLNATDALHPRTLYCDNSTFNTRDEAVPAGVTHMQRLSMRKFKFQSTDDVFFQCKLRACASPPCGSCASGVHRRAQAVDLSPAEGEMFAPPVGVKVSLRDKNALTFPDPSGADREYVSLGPTSNNVAINQPAPVAAAPVQPSTSKAIEVSSHLTLGSVTPSWAVSNRAALTESLRSTLNLRADEELVITSITAARRGRVLQAGGVKIQFTVGVSDASRANASKAVLTQLASGTAAVVQNFSQKLDQELVKRGEPAVNLPTSAITVAVPTTQQKQRTASGVWVYQGSAVAPTTTMGAAPSITTTEQDSTPSKKDGTSSLLLVAATAICALLLVIVLQRGKALSGTNNNAAADADHYNSKVAGLDNVELEAESQ